MIFISVILIILLSETKLRLANEQWNAQVGRGWIPMAVIDSVEEKFPRRVEILGQSYVLWKDPKNLQNENQGWTVMRDYCPHRFAPLSEGRIDPTTGCLECPYHGWQFKSVTGECTRIPQSLPDEANVISTTQTTSQTFPVHLTSQIVWAYLPLSGVSQSFPDLPESIIPDLSDSSRFTIARDVPYSLDFTIENFMDPAHIPFAHHTLQGTRDDAIGISMKILTDIENTTHCEVAFKDRTRKKLREGVVSFIAPIFYSLKVVQNDTNEFLVPLYILVVPVSPGRTRTFISARIPKTPILNLFPKWLLHSPTVKFIDSDIWIHDQEKFIRNPLNQFSPITKGFNDPLLGSRPIEDLESLPRYVAATQSDRGCIAWRRWWKRHFAQSPLFGAAGQISNLSKSDKLNHFEFHTKDCVHCQKALKTAKLLKRLNPLLSLIIVGFSKNFPTKLLGLFTYIVLAKYIESVERATLGPDALERTSAAQFDKQ